MTQLCYPDDFLDKIICADCLTVMQQMPDGCVDAVITDLPYGMTACKWDVVIPFAPMWEQVKRLLKPRGAFVTTASQPFTSKLVMSNLPWFRYEWVWDKVNVTGFLNVKRCPLKRHENIVVFSAGRSRYNPILSGKATRSFGKLRTGVSRTGVYDEFGDVFRQGVGYPQSIIRFQVPTNITDVDFGLHPTQKPVALYEYLVCTYTNEGDIVLDFCLGSGTTAVATKRLGRHFIGIELSPEYCQIAERRLATILL